RRSLGTRRDGHEAAPMSKSYPPVEYSEYLRLDRLLGSQSLRSATHGEAAHDEMLFIVVQQVYELWFKQILHELDAVMALFRADSVDERSIGVAVSRLLRIVEIQRGLIDLLLGLRRAQRVPIERLGQPPLEAQRRALAEAQTGPSLFELVERWLERTPFLE